MRNRAKDRNVGIGPNVRALFDILGDTMEEALYEPLSIDEEEEIDWDDIDVTLGDEFHDATTSPPSSPSR